MTTIEIEHFHKKHLKAYVRFAREEWGESCYQASENYIQWLYNENPCPKISKISFVLAFFEGTIVGCIHKMGWMWQIKNQSEYIPAVHNLMVAQNHRKKGCGMLLLKHSFTGENHVLVPGVIQDQKNIYKFLKCQKVNSSWYRKILTPLKGAYYLTTKKFLNRNAPPAFFSSSNFHRIENINPYFKTSFKPNEEVAHKIVSHLNKMHFEMASTYWTTELFKWRFFHPLGPRHLILYKESDHDIKDFVILSLGPKKGLNVARVIEMEASSLDSLRLLMKEVERITKVFGGHILLNFSSSSKLNNWLTKLKYTLVKTPPNTFFYHKNKKNTFHSFSFNGSVGDFGFESIP